jgi:diacylglycerol kinase family enzyme
VLAFSDTQLAIVPSGSGNGLARELGISRRPVQALQDIVSGDCRRIDVGELGGRLFLNVAGAGFDAHIAREFAACRRRGLARYAWLTVTHLRRFRPRTYTIATPQGERTFDALFVCLANSRQFGNGAIIAPDARVDDGLLNMVVVGRRPPWRVVLAATSLFRGRVASVPDVWSFPVTETEIRADEPVLHHVDGEPVEGDRVLTARLHPGGLLVRLPRTPAAAR